MRYKVLGTVGLVVATVATAFTQKLTIPEAVERMRPAPYVTSRVREVAPFPFEEMVRRSDLIIHASLTKIRTYLSADETELYTDYQVTPFTVIVQRNARSSHSPGAGMPIVLHHWGGETTINGFPVKIYDENLPLLPTDSPLLLFLTYDRKSDKYEIFDGIGGAFQLEDGKRLKHLLTPSVAPSYEHLKGADLAAVIREIHQLGR